ncbi:MAG: glycosyltransferase [Myxococcales bacterium]|jgi:GT2 family glycosyltransferase|nr:glycosyltransferase [Myxococcales bacterium]
MNRRLCDVIIATKDRPEQLRRALDGLLDQTHAGFGVIIVDDGSETPVQTIAESQEYATLDCEVVRLASSRGPAAARNAGADRANAEFILFLDDDVVADRRLVELHLAAVQANADGPIVSCGPFVQPADWGNPTPWNLWEARQAKKEADALSRGDYAPTWRQFHTGNNCLPLDVFRAVGGFDERFLRAEDDELALRLDRHGCKFVFEPSALAWHYSHRSLEAWLLTPRAYAYFDHLMDQLHPEAGFLTQVKSELRRRRLPLRLARVLLHHGATARWGIDACVGLAKLAHARRADAVTMAALSIAYDLSYCRALRDAEQGRSEFQPPSREVAIAG